MKLRNITSLLTASALLVSASIAHAETYVLLIGVCDYPTPVDAGGKPLKDEKGNMVDNDLNGAINDMNSVKEILTGNFGVRSSNVKMLTDKAANTDNLIKELKWLIGSAKRGDQIFIGFSGHGASIPVDGSKEEDVKEEVLVLGDDSLVPDDLFSDLKDLFSSTGINATYFFDSCHSGGMSRDVKGKAKFIPITNLSKRSKVVSMKKFAPLDKGGRIGPKNSLLQITEANAKFAPQGTLASPATKASKTKDGRGEYIFLFSSRENETSIDAKLDGFPAHGLFTLAFTEVLKSEPKFAMGDLVSGIQAFFIENKIPQNPAVEFSSESRSKLPFIL